MIVSVLLPTRKRTAGLASTIKSLVDNADDLTSFEVLLRVDCDDVQTIQHLPELYQMFPTISIVTILDKRPVDGYISLYKLYNQLAVMASGEFLFIFNDDAEITSPGWDTVLKKYANDVSVIRIKTNINDTSNIFPIVHRTIPHILGYFSLHSSLDVQYEILCNHLPAIHRKEFDIICTHGHVDGQSEHVKDGLPPHNPQGVRGFSDKIAQDATLLRSKLNL